MIELRHLLRGLRVVSMHNVCEDRQTHLVFQINLIFSDMTIFIALILIKACQDFEIGKKSYDAKKLKTANFFG